MSSVVSGNQIFTDPETRLENVTSRGEDSTSIQFFQKIHSLGKKAPCFRFQHNFQEPTARAYLDSQSSEPQIKPVGKQLPDLPQPKAWRDELAKRAMRCQGEVSQFVSTLHRRGGLIQIFLPSERERKRRL